MNNVILKPYLFTHPSHFNDPPRRIINEFKDMASALTFWSLIFQLMVIYIAAKEHKQHLPRKKMDFYKKNVCNINLMNSYTFLLLSLSLTLDRLDEVTVAWTKRLGMYQ